MKNILSFLGIVLFSQFLYAQSSSEELIPIWGEEQYNAGKNLPHLHLTNGENGYYAILKSVEDGFKKHKASAYLVRYDHELNIIKKLDLQKIYSNQAIDFFQILNFREKLYLFYKTTQSNSSENELFAQEINPSELTQIGHPVNITNYSLNKIMNEAVSSSPYRDMYKFQFSPDKTKVLIINQFFDSEDMFKGYEFLLLDERLDKLGRMEFPITQTSHKHGIYLPQVENCGNFHFLAGPQQEDEKGKMKSVMTPYQLISYSLETNNTKIKSLELEGEVLSKTGLTLGPSGAIFISGFYRGDETDESKSGLFFLRINPSNHEVLSQKTIPFQQIIASDSNPRLESDIISGLITGNPPFHVKDLLITNDENLILVGETFDNRISMLKANKPLSRRTQAVFGNILAIGLSPLGDLRWIQTVCKNQIVEEKDFELGSFSMWQAENNLFLLFNDNKNNVSLKGKDKIFPFHSNMKKKDHKVSLVSFNDTGIPQKLQIDLYPKFETSTKKRLLDVFLKENNIIIIDKNKNSIRLASLVPHYGFPVKTENAALASDTLNSQR